MIQVSTIEKLCRERSLERIDNFFRNLEGSLQDVVGDARPKQVGRQGDGAGVGAAEGSVSNRSLLAQVDLEVHQPPGEDEHIMRLQHLGEELVGGVNQSHHEHTAPKGQKLRAPWVRMRRVNAARKVG